MTKTPEELAQEFADDWHKDCNYPHEILRHTKKATANAFFAGYQTAKDEEATKDQKIAELWTESIKKMLPSVHEVVLFPGNSTKASKTNKARDDEIIAKMDAAIKKAKGNSSNNSDGWISVKDRLPEEGLEVLIFGKVLRDIPKILGVRARFNGDQEWKYTWESEGIHIYTQDDVTHWMPLPKPPEDK